MLYEKFNAAIQPKRRFSKVNTEAKCSTSKNGEVTGNFKQ